MYKKRQNKSILYLVLSFYIVFLGLQIPAARAQDFNAGADFVNRYVWRGFDFGNSFSVQPHLEFSVGNFTIGNWASYAISPVDNNKASAFGASENDLYASYNFGPFAVGVTDYYFPTSGPDFFNYDNGGNGAHYIEPNVSITGGKSFPLTLYAAFNAYNDPDHSVYLAATVPFTVHNTDLSFTIGGVPTSGKNGTAGYYGNSKAAITNIKLSASHSIKITDDFSLPLFGSYIINPYIKKSYAVFGISL
ncbi:MAG TPA: hypothetical protein VE868_13695 [Balneolaceae bacterium]|nr:hypothetical protein [Balneolaceae bacterium]